MAYLIVDWTSSSNDTAGGPASGQPSAKPDDTRQFFLKSMDDLAALPALHFGGKESERTVTGRGDEVGTATIDGTKVPVITVDGTTYFKPTADMVKAVRPDLPPTALADRWMADTVGLTGTSYGWAAPPSLAALLRGAVNDAKTFPAKADPGTTVGSTPAYKATTPAGDLYIAKDAPYRLLRFDPSQGDDDPGASSTAPGTSAPARAGPARTGYAGPYAGPHSGPHAAPRAFTLSTTRAAAPARAEGDDSELDMNPVTGPDFDRDVDALIDSTKQLGSAVDPSLKLNGSADVQCGAGGCTAVAHVTPTLVSGAPEGTSVGPIDAQMTATFTIAGTPAGACETAGVLSLGQSSDLSCSQGAAGAVFTAEDAKAKAAAAAGAAPGSTYRWRVPYETYAYVLAMAKVDVTTQVDRLQQQKKNPTAAGKATFQAVPRKPGTEQGAREMYERSKELQQGLPFNSTTVAAVRVQNKKTGEIEKWIASSNTTMPKDMNGKLRPDEKYIEGKGHAEQTIVNNLYDKDGNKIYEIVEGGASWNVCIQHRTGACASALWNEGMTIGGQKFPWRRPGVKSDYRSFWFDE
ncbi:hypothetical protein [Yinghuangia seranimata]|uniref:hypothetical protein n=1 Tax=Yinghuangia seranimata TaxID=408067 RepID=UPI00248D20D7|nr:hypothetical protein [Yinghuangia seranimata]MDI2130637.1 hypothetical protein [Yinghuangia seranimata]